MIDPMNFHEAKMLGGERSLRLKASLRDDLR